MVKLNTCLRPARRVAAALMLAALAACGTPQGADPTLDSRLRLSEAAEATPARARAALPAAREAAQRAPNDAVAQERLAITAERAGSPTEAVQALRRAIALQGPTPSRLLALGRMQMLAGDTQGAIQTYTEARALAPNDPSAAGALGLALDVAREHQRAQVEHRAALALSPGDWTLRSNYAMSLLLTAQAPEAVRVLADAEFAVDAPRRARHNLALAMAATGQRAQVVRILRVDMGPAEAEAMAQEFSAFGAWMNALPAAPGV
jgi:Flp pilus assembly protein TadD